MQEDKEPMVRFRGRHLPRSQAEAEIDKYARLKFDLRLSGFAMLLGCAALLMSVWGAVIEHQCLRPSSQDRVTAGAMLNGG